MEMSARDTCPCRRRRRSELWTLRRNFEEDRSFKEALLARKPATVMKPELKHMLRVGASPEGLRRATQKVMPPDQLQEI